MTTYTTGLELILNACESVLQIVITENEKTRCFQQWHEPQKATEILIPALEQMCDLLHIQPTAFRRIGCFAGPGSFTGIRLVLATAAAMRRAGDAKLAALNYMQALATSAVKMRGSLYGANIFVLTHARRDLVHFQQFMSYGPVIPPQPLCDVSLLAPEKAFAMLNGQPCLVCGSALAKYPDLFDCPVTGKGPVGAPEAIMLPELVNPGLGALCLLARHGDYFPEDISPVYVRGCDAVENLIEKKGADSREVRELEKLLGQKLTRHEGPY